MQKINATDPSLFDLICEPLGLIEAFFRARKGLRVKTEPDAIGVHLEREMYELSERLRAGRYDFGPYTIITVRDPKERKIMVAPFRDRIVHHAINARIEPIFERTFIHDSYACRKGKGNLAALQRLQRWVDGQPDCYVLKMDIDKYFASVQRHTLMAIIKRKVCDERTLELLDKLIFSAPRDPDEKFDGRGLPIGNLTSQTFANVYLNVLDHYVKDDLGVRHYLRYVDDFIAIGGKRELHELRRKIVAFVGERLGLTIDPSKDKVLCARNGVPFLGFVVRPNKRARLRKESVKRFLWKYRYAKKMGLCEPDLARKVGSWYAYARFADVQKLLERSGTLKYVDQIL